MGLAGDSTDQSLAGVLQRYVQTTGIKRGRLAEQLGVESRTLRRWLSGATQVYHVQELRRIADVLELPHECFGLAPAQDLSVTVETIEELTRNAWHLVERTQPAAARRLLEARLPVIEKRLGSDPDALYAYAWLLNVSGYAAAANTSTRDVHIPVAYYTKMETVLRQIAPEVKREEVQTGLNIAMTYKGDMYRRQGRTEEAIAIFEQALKETPYAALSARGNLIQLLGRVHWMRNDTRYNDRYAFEQAMDRSMLITYEFAPQNSVTNNQYSQGTVWEESARGFIRLGDVEKGLEHLARAEAVLPAGAQNEIMILTVRARGLFQLGDLEQSVQHAARAARLCHEHGQHRLLERVTALEEDLHRLARQSNDLGAQLRAAINGTIE